MFEMTQCKHPVIVLKDIKSEDWEALLNYMYVGEVNVVQDNLSALIKAAECLKIKGLAVPDEDPMQSKGSNRKESSRKHSTSHDESPKAKRRKRANDSYNEDNNRDNISNEDMINNERNFQDSLTKDSSKHLNSLSNDNRTTNLITKQEPDPVEVCIIKAGY